MGKAVTDLANFKVDPAIAVPTWKVVFLDEFFWDIRDRGCTGEFPATKSKKLFQAKINK